jgi:23S rRNA G2069 N7-methylase RlmK/C1962 C5-methylase RlmI
MEPISMIVGALVAGATAAAKKVGGRAVEQAYDALTGLIADRYKRKGAVAALEEDPSSETQKKALEEALAKTEAPTDAELIQKAKELTQALEQVPRAELTAVGVRMVSSRRSTLASGRSKPVVGSAST